MEPPPPRPPSKPGTTGAMGPPAALPARVVKGPSMPPPPPRNVTQEDQDTPMPPPPALPRPQQQQQSIAVRKGPSMPPPSVASTAPLPPSQGPPDIQVPSWAGEPQHAFNFEVIKGGAIMGKIPLDTQSTIVCGRAADMVDLELAHPSLSRRHAILQHKNDGTLHVKDISTHGTFINKTRIPTNIWCPLHVGDVVKFGESTRLYAMNGPADLMPPEPEHVVSHSDNVATDNDRRTVGGVRSTSLQYGRQIVEKKRMTGGPKPQRGSGGSDVGERRGDEDEGVSWGFREDAVNNYSDDSEDGNDGLSDDDAFQAYLTKNQATLSKQQLKWRDKLEQKQDKIRNLQLEIERIEAKEGIRELSEGQRAQVAKNMQRLEGLQGEVKELKDQIRGVARHKKEQSERELLGKKKKKVKRRYSSDDDDFYDRTLVDKPRKKGRVDDVSRGAQGGGSVTDEIETEQSLMNKLRLAHKRELQVRQQLAHARMQESEKVDGGQDNPEAADSLDAFMATNKVSAQAANVEQLEHEIKDIEKQKEHYIRLMKVIRSDFTFTEIISGPAPKDVAKATTSPQSGKGTSSASDQGRDDKATAQTKAERDGQPKTIHQPRGQVQMLKPKAHALTGLAARLAQIRGEAPTSQPPMAPVTGDSSSGGSGGSGSGSDPSGTDKGVKTPAWAQQPDDYEWKPPSNQTGDGRTSLNDKLGY